MSFNINLPFQQSTFNGGAPVPLLPRDANGNVTKQVFDDCIYDSKYFIKDVALPTTAIRFFQVQVGAIDQVANNAALQFQKTFADTNIVQPGQLERGQTFIVYSLQMQVSIPSNFQLTLQSTGNTTLGLTFPTSAVVTNATAGVIASNLVDTIIKRGVIKLKVGNNYFEGGQIIQFPSEFGVSGYAASSFSGTPIAVVATVPTDGVANNGFGRPRMLMYPRGILAGQNFSIDLEFPVSFTPSTNFQIDAYLRGVRYRDPS